MHSGNVAVSLNQLWKAVLTEGVKAWQHPGVSPAQIPFAHQAFPQHIQGLHCRWLRFDIKNTESHKTAHVSPSASQNTWSLKHKIEGSSGVHVLRNNTYSVPWRKRKFLAAKKKKSHNPLYQKKKPNQKQKPNQTFADCCAGKRGLRFTNHDPTVSL